MKNTIKIDKARYEKMLDALQTTFDMFEKHIELKEIDAEFPRGSVWGIVKAALFSAVPTRG